MHNINLLFTSMLEGRGAKSKFVPQISALGEGHGPFVTSLDLPLHFFDGNWFHIWSTKIEMAGDNFFFTCQRNLKCQAIIFSILSPAITEIVMGFMIWTHPGSHTAGNWLGYAVLNTIHGCLLHLKECHHIYTVENYRLKQPPPPKKKQKNNMLPGWIWENQLKIGCITKIV